MFGFKKKPTSVFETLRQLILELSGKEWTNVVTQFRELENRRPLRLRPIPSKFPELQELFLECVAFHCATLYLTALRLIERNEADYVISGTVQEVSFNLKKYLGSGRDRTALQQQILSRASQLTSFQQFSPEMLKDALLENFENNTMGQHSLATIGLLNLSKFSPEAMLVNLSGRTPVVAAMKTDLYAVALKQSLPGIRLSRAFPGDLRH